MDWTCLTSDSVNKWMDGPIRSHYIWAIFCISGPTIINLVMRYLLKATQYLLSRFTFILSWSHVFSWTTVTFVAKPVVLYSSHVSESDKLKAHSSKVRWITWWRVQYLTNFLKSNHSKTPRPWTSSLREREKNAPLFNTSLCLDVIRLVRLAALRGSTFFPFHVLFYR